MQGERAKNLLSRYVYPSAALTALILVAIELFGRALFFVDGDLFVRHYFQWWDWPMHIGMAFQFAYNEPSSWFNHHHFFAGGKFSYPFLANLISGLLIRCGASFRAAFIVPSIVCFLVIVCMAHHLATLLCRSKIQATVVLLIFFFSSGIGAFDFLVDWAKAPSWAMWAFPPKSYSGIPDFQWVHGNVIIGQLLPQRAFLLGMALGLTSLYGLCRQLERRTPSNRERQILVLSGLAAGILPIAHMHSFIVLFVVAGLLTLLHLKEWRRLIFFVAPAGLVATSLYFWFVHGAIESPSFMKWRPGWQSTGGFFGWALMWLRLWGAALPLALLGGVIMARDGRRLGLEFCGGFLVLFLGANLIWLQPVAWDNSKIFFWVYLALALPVANALAFLWRQHMGGRVAAALLGLSLTLSGALEMARLENMKASQIRILSRQEIELAERIRSATAPGAVFATAPDHNNLFLAWAARPIMMGHEPWVENFGFDARSRRAILTQIYQGGPLAVELILKHRVSYVALGSREQIAYGARADFFRTRYPIAFEGAGYVVYDVRNTPHLQTEVDTADSEAAVK